jgi:hypothetical protein
MKIHRCWTSLLLLLVACPAMAQGKYADPDAAATDAAARQALAQKHIVDIVGVTSGIQSVLQDLGAKVVGQQLTIDLAADVLFDFDKYTLLPKSGGLGEDLAGAERIGRGIAHHHSGLGRNQACRSEQETGRLG